MLLMLQCIGQHSHWWKYKTKNYLGQNVKTAKAEKHYLKLIWVTVKNKKAKEIK